MRTVEEIDREVEELKEKMKEAKGTPTEIYTRIVGYHREIKSWNRGKREEYNHRKMYDIGE